MAETYALRGQPSKPETRLPDPPETSLHLPEKMEKLAGNRQPLGTTLEQKELFFRILAQYTGHRVDVHNCTAAHLPEAVGIEVGEQFLKGVRISASDPAGTTRVYLASDSKYSTSETAISFTWRPTAALTHFRRLPGGTKPRGYRQP
jgi:hypothetical protein